MDWALVLEDDAADRISLAELQATATRRRQTRKGVGSMVGARVGVVIEWILRRDFLSGFLDSQNGAVSSPPSSGHRSPTTPLQNSLFQRDHPRGIPC